MGFASPSRAVGRDIDHGYGRDLRYIPVSRPLQLTTSATGPAAGEAAPRSGFGTVPGAELPSFVYISVLAAYAWIMLAAWLAFAGDLDAGLALGIAAVLALVFFALPIVIRQVAVATAGHRPQTTYDFLSAPVEIATGPLAGSSAWLQILIIPLSLALAATLIGAANILVR